jgi:hypothetical protein
MSSTEALISITVKSHAGSLVTLRAESAEELDQRVALTLASLASATQELEAAIRGAAPVNTAVPPSPVVGLLATQLGATVIAETPAPAGPPAFVSPGAGARNCPHGTMTRIHGLTGKFGPYKGHFCPAKQGDPTKCTTVYVKAGSPEFATFVADQTKA